MELTNVINSFLSSWYFTCFSVVLVIGAGVMLRWKLKPAGKEYKERQHRYDRRR